MKKRIFLFLTCIGLLHSFPVLSQDASALLRKLEKHPSSDSLRAVYLCDLAWYYVEYKADSAIIYARQAINVSKKSNNTLQMLDGYSALGSAYRTQGKFEKAIAVFQHALPFAEGNDKLKGKKCSLINNLANVYNTKRNYVEAIIRYKEAYKLAVELGDPRIQFVTLNNMIGVYLMFNQYDKALKYAKIARTLLDQLNDPVLEGQLYFNLGMIFLGQDRLDDALANLNKAKSRYADTHYQYNLASALNNIGIVYRRKMAYAKSIDSYKKALTIYEDFGDSSSIAMIYENLAVVFQDKNDFVQSNTHAEKGKAIAVRIKDQGLEIRCNNLLIENYCAENKLSSAASLVHDNERLLTTTKDDEAELRSSTLSSFKVYYQKAGDFQKASALSDEILELIERDKQQDIAGKLSFFQVEMEVLEKEKEIEKLNVLNDLNEKEKLLKNAELQVKKNQQYGLLFLLLVVLATTYFFFNRLKITKAKNRIIQRQRLESESQRRLLEEINREIGDSIRYAERIQRSLMVGADLMRQHFGEVFVFFKPRDIVSGDFYWAGRLADGNLLVVNADSTGHGVPGAIMSLLNLHALKDAVEVAGISEPERIMAHARDTIITTLKGDNSEGSNDGMDCTLLVVESGNQALKFSGANHNLWILRDGEMLEFKGDKMPVGKYAGQMTSYTSHRIDLKSGDIIYSFTDGIVDQFGGPDGKKFMRKNLKDLFLQIGHLPMHVQQEKLEAHLNSWMGNHSQVDDICIIGIKI